MMEPKEDFVTINHNDTVTNMGSNEKSIPNEKLIPVLNLDLKAVYQDSDENSLEDF